MRIITGRYRGRKLETPTGYDLRPTTDKVKESIFNILMNDMWDSVCVDLFAGTGGLGLEALSRGARRCYFCDNARNSIDLIKTNIKKCQAEEFSEVIAGDYLKGLSRISKSCEARDEKVDIVFLDPPYRSGLYESCLEQIDLLEILSQEGIIIAEHDSRDFLPERVGNLAIEKERRYGRVMVTVYKVAAGMAESQSESQVESCEEQVEETND